MKRVIRLTESDLRGMVRRILNERISNSYEDEQSQLGDLMEFLESQDASWGKWKEIALSLIARMGTSDALDWAEANGYLEPFGGDEEDEELEYTDGDVYTMANWRHDRNLDNLKPGTRVEDDIVEQLRNGMPPKTDGMGVFQTGEPYSHFKGQPTYMTFTRNGDSTWTYVGLCLAGQTKPIVGRM